MKKLGCLTVAVFLSLGIGGCGGDDDGGAEGDGTSGAGSAGRGTAGRTGGGSGSGSSSTADLTPMDVAAGACEMMNASGGGSADCEGIDEYSECLQDACADEYETCLGSGYKTGNFSGGMCSEYFGCVTDADDVCNNDCVPAGDCLSCLTNTVGGCAANAGCALPSCTAGGTGNAGAGSLPMSDKTCADLKACCDSLDAQVMDVCLMTYDAVKGSGDVACGAAFSGFMSLGCK